MRTYWLWLLFFFCIPSLAFAQTGKIAGYVRDQETGEPIPGANVVILHRWINNQPVSVSPPIGAATDASGYYVILNVPPGIYDVQASFVGYTRVVQQKVEVNAERTTELNFMLAPEVIQGQTIEVVAERPIVQTDVSATIEFIAPTRITAAPVTRVDEFIGKMKGIQLVDTDEGHGLSVRGGAIRETDIRLDGISLRDPRSENSYLNFNTATIEEIQVKTGGFEAKYGGIQSGLINVITKEGNRDRYSLSLQFIRAPAGQRRFFGQSPWDPLSPIYKTFGSKYAYSGVPDSAFEQGEIPDELLFRGFRGWRNRRTGERGLSPAEKQALWLLRHPRYAVATRPDMFFESALTGPLPGKNLPIIGALIDRTTFLFGFKYENTQFAFPLGPRDSYEDWNVQLKLTTRPNPSTKLVLTGMYALIQTINEGRTSDYGGALVDRTNRFNFLSNTESSVIRQARLIGGNWGFQNLWNKGRFQYFDKRYLIGGVQWTHTLGARTYYTLNAQFAFSDNSIQPFAFDTSATDAWFTLGGKRFLRIPERGLPNAQATPISDQLGTFVLSGGASAVDSSYTWVFQLSTNFTHQLGAHHQLEFGQEFKYNHLFVYSGINRSTRFAFEPGFFQYYTARPIEAALYAQDKLEFKGMIATIGVRLEYFNPMRHGYKVEHPLDPDYRNIWEYYSQLPGDINSYERWVAFRKILSSPPGWPKKPARGYLVLSPRVGTSFPITTQSKLYFNYGHFYQRPPVPFLYNQTITAGEVTLPTPDLKPEKTVAFEFGFEQSFFNRYLLNATFYYKDVRNRALPRTYISYYGDIIVHTYAPDGYRDIRGIELRVEKRVGRFLTFWANYDYQVISGGQTGLARIYEDPLKADEQIRPSNIFRGQPRPRAYVNVNLHTPQDFGPEIGNISLLGGFALNPLFEWREGGYIIWNPEELNPDKQLRVDVVDYYNLDLRITRQIPLATGNIEFFFNVFNVLNTRRLITSNMLPKQLEDYKNSLKLPFKSGELQGNDKWGEWDKPHINIGWYTAPLFLNPRRYQFGFRLNL